MTLYLLIEITHKPDTKGIFIISAIHNPWKVHSLRSAPECTVFVFCLPGNLPQVEPDSG